MAQPEQAPDQLAAACDILEHYSTEHTQDAITRFTGEKTVIYIVCDEKWKKRFERFTRQEFPRKIA